MWSEEVLKENRVLESQSRPENEYVLTVWIVYTFSWMSAPEGSYCFLCIKTCITNFFGIGLYFFY